MGVDPALPRGLRSPISSSPARSLVRDADPGWNLSVRATTRNSASGCEVFHLDRHRGEGNCATRHEKPGSARLEPVSSNQRASSEIDRDGGPHMDRSDTETTAKVG